MKKNFIEKINLIIKNIINKLMYNKGILKK